MPETKNVEIKHRWRDEVLYIAQVPADTPIGMMMRVALEQAATDRADLRDADLRDANLRGANLRGANLRDASLRDASLRGASLRGADLRGVNLFDADLLDADLRDADLRGANLRGTNLRGANLRDASLRDASLRGASLRGANLRGVNLLDADLRGDLKLVGDRPLLMIGPIGSESRTIFAYVTDKGPHIKAGCFFGTRDEFAKKLIETHAGNEHEKEYTAALVLIDAHFEIWNETEKGGGMNTETEDLHNSARADF